MSRLITLTTLLQLGALVTGILFTIVGIKVWDGTYPESNAASNPRGVEWARTFSTYGILLLAPILAWFGILLANHRDKLDIPMSDKSLSVICLAFTLIILACCLFPAWITFQLMTF